jgi:hypothetical protein
LNTGRRTGRRIPEPATARNRSCSPSSIRRVRLVRCWAASAFASARNQADGGFTRLEAIEELTRRGTQPFMPVPRSRNPDIDPFAHEPTDSEAHIQ